MNKNSEQQVGAIFTILAFICWGLLPIYFKQVSNVDPYEVLVHRIIWSLVILFFIVVYLKQFSTIKSILVNYYQMKYLLISSFLVSLNWLIFIYAISINKILETSLGYFINPLILVLFGYIFFQEQIRFYQKIAITIATIGVLIQIVAFGSVPIIALGVAISFALYGMVRKKINVPSIPGLFIETLLLFPFAAIYLYYLDAHHQMSFLNSDTYTTVMLLLAGLITAVPLLLFNSGVTRVSLTSVGMIQYIAPTITFLLAVFVYNEAFNISKVVTFIMIWVAIFIFSFGALKQGREKHI